MQARIKQNQNKVFVIGFVLIAIVILWSLARPIVKKFSAKTDGSEEKVNEEIVKAPAVSPKDLFDKMKSEDNVVIVDLRDPADFSKGHIATSINIPIESFGASLFSEKNIGKTADIVLLNQGEEVFEVARKTNELISSGYPNAKYLEGGMSAWQDQGYTLVSGGGSELDKNKIKTIRVENLKNDLLEGREVQFVDLRSEKEFRAGHIPGAVNIQFSEIEKRAKEISSVQKVVAYDSGEDEAQKAAATLFDLNFFNVYVLFGGLDTWKAADGKIEQ